MNQRSLDCILLLAIVVSACGSVNPPGQASQIPTGVVVSAPADPALLIVTATPSPSWTAILPPILTPTNTPTPDPYAGLTIPDLVARTYGGGELRIEQTLADNSYFTRYLVSYPSDGLTIFGFMNVPKGGGSFPVVIASHGYIEPEVYNTLDYTTGYADALARSGYLVIHPNLRGYKPSDDGPNLFRVGMAIDVLNLIALVKDQGGQPGALQPADPERIGLWGHSMGGGISTRVMVVSPEVRAVLLYGAMSGDEQKNYERIFNVFTEGLRGKEELSAPAEAFQRISPVYFLDHVQAAVSIHHGTEDSEVPPEWSLDLCEQLRAINKEVECFSYPGQPHTFYGDGEQMFIQRMIDFYDRYLSSGE